jgi:hypothetical protein
MGIEEELFVLLYSFFGSTVAAHFLHPINGLISMYRS